ncbi:MAG: NAD(P)/FAD-dependent oxidoreductase [Alkalilacustris sp.]
MIANEDPVIAESLWTATANPAPDCPPLEGAAEAEVAVVGGGFCGLSAALHLAEAGVSVRLLEAETPGWGASGRNGGQVNPGLKEDPDTIEARFGADLGGRMVALGGQAADLVFDLIARHGIDCAPARPGWVQPAHDAAGLETVRRRAGEWARRGQPVQLLDAQQTAELLGTDAYVGAMLDERGGSLHPLNYALGLARAAQSAGAVLHGQSRVQRLETAGAEHILHTARGQLRARRVLLCTNGYTDDLVPVLRRTLVPVRSVQVATAPLSDNLRRGILPRGHAASDSRRLLLYFRLDPQGRFVMGGRGDYGRAGTLRQMAMLREAARALYPQLSEADWTHQWGGYVAMTPDHYPHMDEVAPGVMAGLGFNGRGVAMATALGRVLADWAMGVPDGELPFPVTRPRPIPFHGLRKPVVRATVAWYRLRDRLGV